MEIVIPDLEDDDDDDLPLPRFPGHGFGHSPSNSITSPQRSASPLPGGSRPRGDSDASLDAAANKSFAFPQTATRYTPVYHQDEAGSTTSLHSPVRPSLKQRSGSTSSQGHHPQYGMTTASQPSAPFQQAPVKKSSFANLKNAFRAATTGGDKASAASAVPPLPSAPSSSGYPSALKNPFHGGRSGSSTNLLTQAPPPRPAVQRAPGSSMGIERRDRAKKPSGNSVHSHATRPSEYSYTTNSTSGSSHTAAVPQNVPVPSWPVGQIPQPMSRSLRPSLEQQRPDQGARSAVPEPHTPAEYGLHVAFRRFVSSADDKMRALLLQPLHQQIPLAFWAGPEADPAFDDVLRAIAFVARSQGRPVIDSIMGWCNMQKEGVSRAEMEAHMRIGQPGVHAARTAEVSRLLLERKTLGAVYIIHRALAAIMNNLPKDFLQGTLGAHLEQHLFETYRFEQPESSAITSHRSEIVSITAELIGKLSRHRFLTLCDRFIGAGGELEALITLPNPNRDIEARADYLLKGMWSFSLRAYPDSELEYSAEFLDRIAELFSMSHSMGVKLAFGETLVRLLHPLPTTMDVETNHPIWAKAIAAIHVRAVQMANKSRFWHQAFPIAVVSLCVSPRDAFKEKWQTLLQQAVQHLNDKAVRAIAYNSIVRLVWVYMHRCPDSATSTARRLDQILASCLPKEDDGEPSSADVRALTNLVHVIFAHDPEYGRQVVEDFLDDSQIEDRRRLQPRLADLKARIGLHATLLSLLQARQDNEQGWPANSDFRLEVLPSVDDVGDDAAVSFDVYKGVDLAAIRVKIQNPIATLISSVSKRMEHMNYLDGRFGFAVTSELPDGWLAKRDGDLISGYPESAGPDVELLKVLLSTVPGVHALPDDRPAIASAVSSAVMHPDPALRLAARNCIMRMMAEQESAATTIGSLTDMLFDNDRLVGKTSADFVRANPRRLDLMTFWETAALSWFQQAAIAKSPISDAHKAEVAAIEAAAVYLLVSPDRSSRKIGAEILAATADIASQDKPMSVYGKRQSRLHMASIIRKDTSIHGALSQIVDAASLKQELASTSLAHQDQDKLLQWYRDTGDISALQTALETSTEAERVWSAVLASQLQALSRKKPAVAGPLRRYIARRVRALREVIAHSGHMNKAKLEISTSGDPSADDQGKPAVAHFDWYFRALCSLTVSDDQAQLELAKITFSCRDLLLLVTPYLGMLDDPVCDIAIRGLARIPATIALPVMRHLQKLQSHAIDDPKLRSRNASTIRPDLDQASEQSHLFLAVSRTYALLAPVVTTLPLLQNLDVIMGFMDYLNGAYLYLADEAVHRTAALKRLQWDFCEVVNQIGMATAGYHDVDRIISSRARASIFRLCQKWCLVQGTHQSATSLPQPQTDTSGANIRGEQHGEQSEQELSQAAGHAMAALCHNPIDFAEATSQRENDKAGRSVLGWAQQLLSSDRLQLFDIGSSAIHGLLQYNWMTIREDAMHLLYSENMALPLEKSLFHGVANAFLASTISLESAEAIVLAMTRLGHMDLRTRLLALQVLGDTLGSDYSARLKRFYGAIISPSVKVYSAAQADIATEIASARGGAQLILAEITKRAPPATAEQADALLHVLAPWMGAIELTTTSAAQPCLDAVMYLDIKLGVRNARSIGDLWSRLMDGQEGSAQPVLLYLIRQATSRSRTEDAYVRARRAVLSFAGQRASSVVFPALMSLVDSDGLLCHALDPAGDSVENSNIADSLDLSLGPVMNSQAIATAQVAMLLAGQVVAETTSETRLDTSNDRVKLLHALLSHVDAESQLVRRESRAALGRCLAAWTGSEQDSAADPTSIRNTLLSALATGSQQFWSAETDVLQPPAFVPPTMAQLVSHLIQCLSARLPSLRQLWGTQALLWATECTLPSVACRSFQIFRVLMSDVSAEMLASIISRYSITVAGTSTVVRKFNAELLHTLCCIVQATPSEALVQFPQLFWTCQAALRTPVEREYQLVVDLLAFVLDKVDISDPDVLAVTSHRKLDTPGSHDGTLQLLLMRGLTSSRTMLGSFDIIRRLAGITSATLIDHPDRRLSCTVSAVLPWLLQADEADDVDPELAALAEDIALLCEVDQQADMARIMRSFAQRKFRAKGEFTKQAIACLRSVVTESTGVVVGHLVQMLLNKEEWVKRRSLQILGGLAKEPQVRLAVEQLGPKGVIPALRLLSSPLASLALEFLETPAVFTDTSGSSDVVRCSLLEKGANRRKSKMTLGSLGEYDEDSGWHSGDSTAAAEVCKTSMEAVTTTFKPETRARSAHFSTLQFDKRIENPSSTSPPPMPLHTPTQVLLDQQASLGDLVGALHDLSSFFSETDVEPAGGARERIAPVSPRGRQADSDTNERKVRAILARSLLRRSSQSPIDWTRGASISDANEEIYSVNEPGLESAEQPAVEADRVSIAEQLSRWRGQSAHAPQASFSSIGSRSLGARSGGSQFDLDEQEETEAAARSVAMLGSANRQAWSHESPRGNRVPASMRNFVLNGERPTTPRAQGQG